MSQNRDQVTVQRQIPAPANVIFDLLADPARHVEIDGSGEVRNSRGGSSRLKLGDTFGMDMKQGLPYVIRNVVIEFEEDRLITWQSLAQKPFDKFVTGRTWSYRLEPNEGGTLVSETWDISTEAWPARAGVRRLAGKTRKNMAKTLETIERVVAVG